MHIIFGESAKDLDQKFTVLELDTIKFQQTGQTVTSYCLVENIPLGDFPVIDAYVKVHHDMMQAYRDQNWEYVETAIKGLSGKWNGEVDSFYEHLFQRVQHLKENPPGDNWEWAVVKD